MDQSINQSINQSTNQSIIQSINQSIIYLRIHSIILILLHTVEQRQAVFARLMRQRHHHVVIKAAGQSVP